MGWEAEVYKIQNSEEERASLKGADVFISSRERASRGVSVKENLFQYSSKQGSQVGYSFRRGPSEYDQCGGHLPPNSHEFGQDRYATRNGEDQRSGVKETNLESTFSLPGCLDTTTRMHSESSRSRGDSKRWNWETCDTGREGGLQSGSRGGAIFRRNSSSRGAAVSRWIVKAIERRFRVLKNRLPIVLSDALTNTSKRFRIALVFSSTKMQRMYQQWKTGARRRLSAIGVRSKWQARAKAQQAAMTLRAIKHELILSKRPVEFMKQRGKRLAHRTKCWTVVNTRMLQARTRVAGKASLRRCGGITVAALSVVRRGGSSDHSSKGQGYTTQQQKTPIFHEQKLTRSDPGCSMLGVSSRPTQIRQVFPPEICTDSQSRCYSMESLAFPRILDHCGANGVSPLGESVQRPVDIRQESERCRSQPHRSTRLFQPFLRHAAETDGAPIDAASAFLDSRGATLAEELERDAQLTQMPEAAMTREEDLPVGGTKQELGLPSREENPVGKEEAILSSANRNEFEQVLKAWKSKEMQATAQRNQIVNAAREQAQMYTASALQSSNELSKQTTDSQQADSPVEETAAPDLVAQPWHGGGDQSNTKTDLTEEEQRQSSHCGFQNLVEEMQHNQSHTNPFAPGQHESEEGITAQSVPHEPDPDERVIRRESNATEKTEPLCANLNCEKEKKGWKGEQDVTEESKRTRQRWKGLWMLPTKWELFGLLLGALFVYVLIFLCTRGAPQALLLLFCCLFGLRIRVGGSDSKGGGSYTAMWLLLVQLLVIISLCIVSLTKQSQNVDQLTEQLEKGQLYTADIRITGTLLLVALAFASFVTGFLILGHLGFNSFYSFVFQPLELCILGVPELRNCNLGLQLASAICLCLGGYSKCGGLIIFLILVLSAGRLLVRALSHSKPLEYTKDMRRMERNRLLFLTGMVIQVVALSGVVAVLCTTPHNGTETLTWKLARDVFALAGFAAVSDVVFVIAQLAAYKFASRLTTPCQRAAILAAGGIFNEPIPQVYIVGRHNVHYDVESCLYSSTYSYSVVVQRYAVKVFWVHRLVTFKVPLPKALRDQQHLHKTLQALPLKTAGSSLLWASPGGSLQQHQAGHFASPPRDWRSSTGRLAAIKDSVSFGMLSPDKEGSSRASPTGPREATEGGPPICSFRARLMGCENPAGMDEEETLNKELPPSIPAKGELSEEPDSSRVATPGSPRKSSKTKSRKHTHEASKTSSSKHKSQSPRRRNGSSIPGQKIDGSPMHNLKQEQEQKPVAAASETAAADVPADTLAADLRLSKETEGIANVQNDAPKTAASQPAEQPPPTAAEQASCAPQSHFSRQLERGGEKVLQEMLQKTPGCREALLSLHRICSSETPEELPLDLQVATVLQFVWTLEEEHRLQEQQHKETAMQHQQQEAAKQQQQEPQEQKKRLKAKQQQHDAQQQQERQNQPKEQQQLGDQQQQQEQQKQQQQEQQPKQEQEQQQHQELQQERQQTQQQKMQQQKMREPLQEKGVEERREFVAAVSAEDSAAAEVAAAAPDEEAHAESAPLPSTAKETPEAAAAAKQKETHASELTAKAEESPSFAAVPSVGANRQLEGEEAPQSAKVQGAAAAPVHAEEVKKVSPSADDDESNAQKRSALEENAAGEGGQKAASPKAAPENAAGKTADTTGGVASNSAAEASTVGCPIPLLSESELEEALSPHGSRDSLGGPSGAPLITEEEADQIEERLLQQVAEQQQAASWRSNSVFFLPFSQEGLRHVIYERQNEAAAAATKTRDPSSDGDEEAKEIFSVFLSKQTGAAVRSGCRSASVSPCMRSARSSRDLLSRTQPPSLLRCNSPFPPRQELHQERMQSGRPPRLEPPEESSDEGYLSGGPFSSGRPSMLSTRPSAGSSWVAPSTAPDGPPPLEPPAWALNPHYEPTQLPLLQQRRGAIARYYEEEAPPARAPRGRSSQQRTLSSTANYISAADFGLVDRGTPTAASHAFFASALPHPAAAASPVAFENSPILRSSSVSGGSNAPTAILPYRPLNPLPQGPACQVPGGPQGPPKAAGPSYPSQYPASPSASWRQKPQQEETTPSYGLAHAGSPRPREAKAAFPSSISTRERSDAVHSDGDLLKRIPREVTPRRLKGNGTLQRLSGWLTPWPAAEGKRECPTIYEETPQEIKPSKRDQETQALVGSRNVCQSEEERTQGRKLQESFERLSKKEKQQQQQLQQQLKQQQELLLLQEREALISSASRKSVEGRTYNPQRVEQQPQLASAASSAAERLHQKIFPSISPAGASLNSPQAAPKEPLRGHLPAPSLLQQQVPQPPTEKELTLQEMQRLLQGHQEGIRLQQQRQQQLVVLQQQQREFLVECQKERHRSSLRSKPPSAPQTLHEPRKEEIKNPLKEIKEKDALRETSFAEEAGEFLFTPEAMRLEFSFADPMRDPQIPTQKPQEARKRGPAAASAEEQQVGLLCSEGGTGQETLSDQMERLREESRTSALSSYVPSLLDGRDLQGASRGPWNGSPVWGVFGLSRESGSMLREPDLDSLAVPPPARAASAAAGSFATAAEGMHAAAGDANLQLFFEPAAQRSAEAPKSNELSIHEMFSSSRAARKVFSRHSISTFAESKPQRPPTMQQEKSPTRNSTEAFPPAKAAETNPQMGATADAAVEADICTDTAILDVFGLGGEEKEDDGEEAAADKKQQVTSNKITTSATGSSGFEVPLESSDVFALPPEAEQQQQEWQDAAKAAAEGRQQIAAAAAAAAAAVAAATTYGGMQDDPSEPLLPPELQRAVEAFQMEESLPPLPGPMDSIPLAEKRRSSKAASSSTSSKVRRASGSVGASKDASGEKTASSGIAKGQEEDGWGGQPAKGQGAALPPSSGPRSSCRGADAVALQQQRPHHHQKPIRDPDLQQGLSANNRRGRRAPGIAKEDRTNKGRHEIVSLSSQGTPEGAATPLRDLSQSPLGLGASDGETFSPHVVDRYYMRERRGRAAASGAAAFSGREEGVYTSRSRNGGSLSRRGSRLDFSGAPAAARALAAKVKARIRRLNRQETEGPGTPYMESPYPPLQHPLAQRLPSTATAAEHPWRGESQGFAMPELPFLMRAKEQREINRNRCRRARLDQQDIS